MHASPLLELLVVLSFYCRKSIQVIAIEVLHTKDVRGWAPILAACANGHLAVARWLFAEESEACGKELRAPTLPGGWTPMIIACKQGAGDGGNFKKLS